MGRVDNTTRATFLSLVLVLAAALLQLAAAGPARNGGSASHDCVPNQIIVKFRQPVAGKLMEGTTAAGLPQELTRLNAKYNVRKVTPLFKNFPPGPLLQQNPPNANSPLVSGREKRLLARLTRAPKNAKVPDLGRIYKIELDLGPGQSLSEAVEAYWNSPEVEYADLNYVVSISTEPDDPLFPLQWALANEGQIYPESGKYNHPPGRLDSDIDAPHAWDIITDASEVIIAVLDTGVDFLHRDLCRNMWVNQAELYGAEGIDDDNNGYVDDVYGYDFINRDPDPQDDHGHGTHVSGIIAADGNNALDIAGVCWRAQIMALKFLGTDGTGDTVDAAEAVYYAVKNGADILNNSWGGFRPYGGYPRYLKEAFDYAYSQGVISVASAGNKDIDDLDYPAMFDRVIAVAATNSEDEKPSFSNYGEAVDIAAPGVDILSLRPQGISIGTIYDAYTTVLSGTSMACPHVSGSLALMLSYYPGVNVNLAKAIIMQTTDPISPDICISGRLNLYAAILAMTAFYRGTVFFDRDVYSCSDTVRVFLEDLHLAGSGTYSIPVTTSGGDAEVITLIEDKYQSGAFTGTIPTASGDPIAQDGNLQLAHLQTITATYDDENDGTGNPATALTKADIDCQYPLIFNVSIKIPGPEPLVTFETNEHTTASVLCGPVCGGPYNIERTSTALRKTHTIKLSGVDPWTHYFCVIRAFDVARNRTVDDNNGLCYTFTTTGPALMRVPGQHPNIQTAIDQAWDGSIVLLADGRHTGKGNRDIDFKGKAVTIRSENGPENCVIDCEGTIADQHVGFIFRNSESLSSVLDGLTITNACITDYRFGGAVTCKNSSPTIANCIITANRAKLGAGIQTDGGSPRIANCTIMANTAEDGAAMSIWSGDPTIVNCIITGNSAEVAAGISIREQGGRIINSTICGNKARFYAALVSWVGMETVSNCIVWDNMNLQGPQFVSLNPPSYSCIQGCLICGIGHIEVDPCFVDAGYWDPNGTLDNTDDDFWVQGDYHLKSQGWRWEAAAEVWTWDDVTSRCIDAGNPGAKLDGEAIILEVDPLNRCGQNIRIEMGAYGGTEQASIPPYDWALLADLTNDGKVDLRDLAYWLEYWLISASDLPADLNRNGVVDMHDFAHFAQDWLIRTSWHH